MKSTSHLHDFLSKAANASGILVTVIDVQGSGPRGPGAWMAVYSDMEINTIGGGHLELQAIQHSRGLLNEHSMHGHEPQIVRYALGPALGQCCGGVVHLKFELVTEKDIPELKERLQTTGMPVALFGGGHVGTALVQVLSRLPMNLRWIDSRDEIFPTNLPLNVTSEHSEPVQSAVADLLPNSAVLIMSFSHAEDLDVVIACLQRQRQKRDLRYVGLIGSKTKWATFKHRLESRGFSQDELAFITCPIGVPGISGKEPEVIAVAVAAQLLQLTR